MRWKSGILATFPSFFPARAPAYLFLVKKIMMGSHNEYPCFEARSCQTRIVGTARTTPVHQIVSSVRWEGYAAASRIPMVLRFFASKNRI